MFNREDIKTDKSASLEKKMTSRNKVDINILLNRVRADKKKEKIESYIFTGLITLSVVIVGFILSFR